MAKSSSGRNPSGRSKAKLRARYRAAAVCAPGLESICADELRSLGLKPKPGGPGIVEFDASPRQLYSANVWLRTSSRVIVRLDTFRATDFFHLQDHASRIDWSRLVPPGHAPRFRISSNDSKLYHTKAIAQRLHQVSLPPSMGEPEQLFIVRIDRNNVTISIDSSGDALHKRPWRTDLGDAPLRTTMAAAIVIASGWKPTETLIDPFCGSGVIGIEAALMAMGIPPGGQRPFAFQDWTDFEAGSWASVAGSIASAGSTGSVESPGSAGSEASDPQGQIVLSDRDKSAVESARANAERAGVADAIEFDQRVVAHLKGRTDTGMVVTNPPYGRRLGKGELQGLYSRLGAVVRERLGGYGLAVLTPDSSLAKAADDRLKSAIRFRHGGLAVELYQRPADPLVESKAATSEAAKGEIATKATAEDQTVADGIVLGPVPGTE